MDAMSCTCACAQARFCPLYTSDASDEVERVGCGRCSNNKKNIQLRDAMVKRDGIFYKVILSTLCKVVEKQLHQEWRSKMDNIYVFMKLMC